MEALTHELEEIFSKITSQNYPLEWDENHITYSLMREMRKSFVKRIVRYKDFTKIIEWFSYKNKGRMESAVGDISLLVNIQFSTGEKLQGVAFIEAKRDGDKDNFPSMSIPQLQRIHGEAPYAHLLLYLHKPEELALKFPDASTWESNIWATPINTALQKLPQIKLSENRRVLRTALPFSMLITSRFFWGLDLDYREQAFKQALEGVGNITPPPFLGIINVYYEGQAPLDMPIPDTWEPI